jgi:hypothetical protein
VVRKTPIYLLRFAKDVPALLHARNLVYQISDDLYVYQLKHA